MWKTAVLEEQSTSHCGCQLGSPSVSSLEMHTNKQSTVVSSSLEKQTPSSVETAGLYPAQNSLVNKSISEAQHTRQCTPDIIMSLNGFSSDHL